MTVAKVWQTLFGKKPEAAPERLSQDDWAQMYNPMGPWSQVASISANSAYQKQEEPDGSYQGLINGAYKRNGVIFACCIARQLLFSEARFQFQGIKNGRPQDLFGTPELEIFETPWPNATTGELLFHPSPHPTRSTFTVDRMRRLGDGDLIAWGPGVRVPISTLDALIATHGVPRFCKIDVEGYEPEVFRGLSQPLPALSFEFHGELLDDASGCIETLGRLGMNYFNVVLHPSGRYHHQKLNRLYFPTHVSGTDLITTLRSIAARHALAGDVWAFSEG